MSDERAPRLERFLEATARKVGGGQLHPLELLQRVQAAAEASVRDGAVANDYAVAMHPSDYGRYSPVFLRVQHEAIDHLTALARRRGWKQIGDFSVSYASSGEAAEGVPIVSARFAERRHRDNAPPAGATRLISRHRNLVLRLGDGSTVRLTHTPFTIGRGRGNDLILSVLSVSRHHGEIVRTPEGMLIRDLGSRNGLVVEGVRVSECLLDPGVTVILGDAQLRLEHV